jgi:hypothetical protein
MKLHAFFSLLIFISAIFAISCNNNTKIDVTKESAALRKTGLQIETSFLRIISESEYLADYVKRLYANQENYNIKKDTTVYKEIEGGMLYKPFNDGYSAVYVSGHIPVNNEIRKIVHFTSPVDSLLKEIVHELGPLVVQSYFCEMHSYFRIFPYLDVLGQFQPKRNILDYNVYYLSDQENNPGKKAVMINNPYVDPAGRGWIISAIAPVYFNNMQEGVVGLDISIEALRKKFLTDENPDIMLVDSSGIVIIMDEKKTGLFEMPTLKSHKYLETIRNNEYLGEDFNLLCSKNKNIRKAFTELLRNNKEYTTVTIDEDEYYLISYKIENLNWFLIKIINTNQSL